MLVNGHKERGVISTYVIPVLSLATGFLLITVVLVWNARFTVASDEKTDDLGYYSYGYKIEKYYVRNTFRLTFWSSRGMEFVHEQGQMTVEAVEQRWIKNGAAIYLNLQIKYHDSIVKTQPARMIFDFHRGEIHTSSRYTLWRNFDNAHKGEDWMSDTEFDEVLSKLEK
ncbi:MAG: hypothetical protein PSX80_09260 [bacterium]|nr:hypothetical protein [bacterium]